MTSAFGDTEITAHLKEVRMRLATLLGLALLFFLASIGIATAQPNTLAPTGDVDHIKIITMSVAISDEEKANTPQVGCQGGNPSVVFRFSSKGGGTVVVGWSQGPGPTQSQTVQVNGTEPFTAVTLPHTSDEAYDITVTGAGSHKQTRRNHAEIEGISGTTCSGPELPNALSEQTPEAQQPPTKNTQDDNRLITSMIIGGVVTAVIYSLVWAFTRFFRRR